MPCLPYYLKPCPFCGSMVYIEKKPLWQKYGGSTHGYYNNYEYIVQCPNEECRCTIKYSSCNDLNKKEEEAIKQIIKAWNTRYYDKENKNLNNIY